jgi:elongation factor G
MPEAELQNLIVDLRSATAGVGTFTAKFDHLSELTGKIAEQVLSSHKAEAA